MRASRARFDENRGTVIGAYTVLAIGLAFALVPIIWMLVVSMMGKGQIFAYPPEFIPNPVTGENYQSVLDNSYVINGIKNGVIVSVATTVLALLVGSLAGWGLAMFPFRGSEPLVLLMLATQMTPLVVLLIPLYQLFVDLQILDSQVALVFVYSSFTVPFAVWMTKGFFEAIPRELVDAAMIDGISRLGALRVIGIPLARNGLIATMIFSFLLAWDEYVLATTLIQADELRTMPPMLILSFIGQFSYQWGPMMASAVLVSFPILIVFLAFQKYIVQGLTAGAVKG